IVYHEDKKRFDKFFEKLIKDGKYDNYEGRIINCKGNLVWVQVNSVAVFDENGNLTGSKDVVRDITARKQSEAKIHEQEEFFRSLIENSTDVVSLQKPDGTIYYNSPNNASVFGYSAEENIGQKDTDLIHPEDLEIAQKAWQEALNNPGKLINVAYRYKMKNGNYEWIESSQKFVQNEDEEPFCIVNARNIHKRKVAEEKLIEQEEFYRSLIENSHDVITIEKPDGTILYNSPNNENLYGYNSTENIGKTSFDFVHPDDFNLAKKTYKLVEKNPGKSFPLTVRYKVKGEKYLWIESNIKLFNKDNKESYYIINSRDIDEQRRAEIALAENEKRYRSLFERNLSGVYRASMDGTITECNDAFAKVMGYTKKEEVIGKNARQLYDNLTDEIFSETLNKNKGSLQSHESCLRLVNNGKIIYVLENAALYNVGTENGYMEGTLIDITDKKQAELDALQNEKRFRSLVEANPDAIFRIDKEGNYIDFHAQEGHLILPRERFIGTNISQNLLKEDVTKLKEIIAEVIKTGRVQTFSHSYEHNGKIYYFEIRVSKSGEDEVLKVVRNITDRRLSELAEQQAKHELEKTEARFRELVHNSSEITCVVTPKGKILYMSPSVENAVGFESEEVVGKNILDFIHPDDVKEMLSKVITPSAEKNGEDASFINGIKKEDYLIRRVKHKYSDRWLYFRMVSSNQIRNPNVQGIIINAQNVTDLIGAQEDIKNAYQLVSKEKLQALKYQSRLLSSQLNPHFMFNALNSVQYYVLNEEAEPALDFVSDFSKLIRATLKNSLKDYINLSTEIEFLTSYLKLEQQRFRDKFDFTIEVAEDIDEQECFIPPMLLQPYVENTLVHGIANKPTKGKVKITFSVDESDILCTIDDDGVGREEAIKLRTITKGKDHVSIATDLTALRLDVLNKVSKGKYSSKIIDKKTKSGKSKGTCVEIRFPKISFMEE
ncbi:MAG: PAS domain S-box protein, partial [Bacteroidia bacterium]